MAGLKPQEIRCLLLKAEGLSYQEICEVTGFSYTKVNRCITEGRRAFLERVATIESGAECERLSPLISKVADGEASADEMRTVRPHLKGCLACKATLREYRSTPSRLAGLVPPVAVLTGGGGGGAGFFARLLQAAQDRFAGLGDVAGAKTAAVAASAVVLAGGGAAGVGAMHHDPPRVAPAAFTHSVAEPAPAVEPSPAASSSPDPVVVPTNATASEPASASPASGAADKESPDASDTTPAATPEFDPGTAAPSSSPSATAHPAPKTPAATGGGEFGP
jgi:hypothetical protein